MLYRLRGAMEAFCARGEPWGREFAVFRVERDRSVGFLRLLRPFEAQTSRDSRESLVDLTPDGQRRGRFSQIEARTGRD
jgi:hypothetical protein